MNNILHDDFAHLKISRSLAHLLKINNLQTLEELLDTPMKEWFRFTGFNQHLLNELINFLSKAGLMNLVRD
jgi:hypothetical protein